MNPLDLAILQRAERQLSIITSLELRQLGCSRRQEERRTEGGLLVALHRGVYRTAGSRPSFEGDVLAACRATGGWASHRCGGALFGMRRITARQPEIVVTRSHPPELAGVLVRRVRRLAPEDVSVIGIIPVTVPARILLDLAGLAPELLEGALNDALLRHLTTLGALERQLARTGTRGRMGAPALKRLIEQFRDGRRPTQSELEDDLLALLRRFGLPQPEQQFEVKRPGRPSVWLDFAYPGARLGVEADGDKYHSSPTERARGRRRDASLAVLDWEVLHFGRHEIDHSPDEVAAQVDAVLRSRLRRAG
jgi:very-short-patch-repair endonuclease